jgi:hypothetical protein
MRKITRTTKAAAQRRLKARDKRNRQAKAAARGAKYRPSKGALPSRIGTRPKKPAEQPAPPARSKGKRPAGLGKVNVAKELADLKAVADKALAADMALPIEELDLPVSIYNEAKKHANVVGDLVAKTRRYFTGFCRMSERTADAIETKLAGMGLGFKPPIAA